LGRFYANENFPLPVVEELRKLGHIIITVQESQNTMMKDSGIFEYIKKNNMVLLTLNRLHFIHIHNKNKDHPGIIVCTFDSNFKRLANNIDKIFSNNSPLKGKLIRVNKETE
jgi:hypothetical protein